MLLHRAPCDCARVCFPQLLPKLFRKWEPNLAGLGVPYLADLADAAHSMFKMAKALAAHNVVVLSARRKAPKKKAVLKEGEEEADLGSGAGASIALGPVWVCLCL